MSNLPVPFDEKMSGLSSRQFARARRAQASSELAVFRHGLAVRAQAEMTRLDSEALADVSRTAFDLECDLLDYGLARAGRSAAKAALVARHVERVATINDRRITARFGG